MLCKVGQFRNNFIYPLIKLNYIMEVERINKNTGKVEQREVKTIDRNDIAPGCKQIDINDLFAALYGK